MGKTAATSTATSIPAPCRVPPPPPPQQAASFSTSYSSSSPRQFPSDIIPEESAEDSGCDSLVEPVTPVSGYRYSQDFTTLHNHHDYSAALQRDQPISKPLPLTPKRLPALIPPASAPPAPTATRDLAPPSTDPTPQTPLSRRSARGSASSFKRTVSNLFRRSNSADKEREFAIVDTPALAAANTRQSSGGSTSRSGSSLDMIPTQRSAMAGESLAGSDDFKKKGRAATGLTLRGRAVNFVVGRGRQARGPRRASSFDADDRAHTPAQEARSEDEGKTYPLERLPWPLPPDAGTGVKARRMSLSLPDDFTIDVAELLSEFEYQHKILGRHGKHLGKGAASRVTLMVRKGCPSELYAVKEFRGKSHRESQAEYEKKIKSEFSIGKSLHHPNIVETIRLCTDHSRWNHVMEYCSEGDLFGLVQKGHLKGDDKKKDRLCLFKQLIQGVGYLHANGIAHRDIKLENLLLTKDSKLKITDFGVSEVFSGTHPGLREAGGHEPYIAPEVLEKRDQYDARALDVWSSAIVMIYLTFGGAIWSRAEPGNLHYDKLVAGWAKWDKQHPECDACITDTDYPKCLALDVGVNPPALRRLLLQMLNPNPRRRIVIEDVLNNRWMKNVECCQVESYDDQAQMIDASKKDFCSKPGARKIFCHNHLPPKSSGSHSLGKMPGQAGY
ncbi:kinase [Hirsutella rhossiliensis]|uniref:non-specific serine/threonine protein kinase n=1 Tax=Hirsutella rhossiliensis TaxID=111463 RepID=A0A9P8N1V7_9HYPO|nr:kinase [Hirsutella rhossiliensis]KAH0964379.1 kinase [Hirsutella rhossiliensis]